MKTLATFVLLFTAMTLIAGTPPDDKTASGLDKLKQLVGTWKGTGPEGKPVTLSYRLVSGETTLMETLDMADKKENMISVYHLDDKNVMMTHYCSLGNQPRMRLSQDAKDPNRFVFNFVDATNLDSKKNPHMHKLIVTLKDSDHFTQEWFMQAEGKENPSLFSFERVK